MQLAAGKRGASRFLTDSKLEDIYLKSHRRGLLAGLLLLPSVCPQQAGSAEVLRVGPQQQFATIADALAVALPRTVVLVDPGRYEEQLQISTSVTIAPAQQVGSVVIACNTQQPYQHCMELPSSSQGVEVRVQGVRFEHYSKSVANNYCIFAQAGRLVLEQCNITSRSGVGVGIEGAQAVLQDCTVHDCERHGVAVFGSLEGALGSCEVLGSSILANKLNGILAKDDAMLTSRDSVLSGNGSFGAYLASCSAVMQGNAVRSNKKGSIALELSSVTIGLDDLERDNQLSQPVALL